jgi:pSer/pThr/pTyr-binding forkhead associated (FHA) protein
MPPARVTTRPPPPKPGEASALSPTFDAIISSEAGVSSVPLPALEQTVIGRDPSCNIVIRDESVSRRHAIIYAGSPPTFEDLDSTNGTFLVGRRLEPGRRIVLPVGSVVQLGLATLVLSPRRTPLLPSMRPP